MPASSGKAMEVMLIPLSDLVEASHILLLAFFMRDTEAQKSAHV